jgi:hypothetical protein
MMGHGAKTETMAVEMPSLALQKLVDILGLPEFPMTDITHHFRICSHAL